MGPKTLEQMLNDIDAKHQEEPNTNTGSMDLDEWYDVPGMDPEAGDHDEMD